MSTVNIHPDHQAADAALPKDRSMINRRARQAANKSLRFESLEDRRLMAATAIQVMLLVGQFPARLSCLACVS